MIAIENERLFNIQLNNYVFIPLKTCVNSIQFWANFNLKFH